jgi:S-adenosylmethionine:tRNA ribosyltransferase-isomerase
MREFSLSDFDFELPEALIAQIPPPTRGASRLLAVQDPLADMQFSQLGTLLKKGDLLVFNNTRVMRARLFGRKPSGGAVELLIERILGESRVLSMLRSSKSPKAGAEIEMLNAQGQLAFKARVVDKQDAFYVLDFDGAAQSLIEAHGQLPLPPYITHTPDEDDEKRYQTVYAKTLGAVAAPTAGLHFDEAMLAALKAQGVALGELTLHVGAGTFKPVRTENIAEHQMHSEWFEITPELAAQVRECKAQGGRVVAVGTTSLRALESAAVAGELQAGARETSIFITPGYRFQIASAMITNFHLPKSTLLMLVSAFAGYEPIMAAYRHAVRERYRFFSYGDAMFLSATESSHA